ncbi:TetR/AcrR family transcriptional regulator [Rhodococcus sp. TAF43]|uniref:TetR/AcrR family transcriptional regulator n=1 Tax=unclassified Rhodococcus (in: high G+C Gram-positive bacteria) TaxID=192944 RepID=UPI000E09F108|nr:TetR/AcrR family transcriptional regulator [Rhodococcus sp. AG1013]RDI16709.1 TetR family transcriptional regulator [Rhodococcus sp. AG1013]
MSKKRQAQHRLGPQRNPEIDDAVLQATRELLVENGYAGTSIDAIATRAGVGRPAIYRRWPSKAHIVHDAVYPVAESENVSDLPIGEEVERLTYGAVALFGGPAAREAVPALMSEVRTDETLRQALLTDQLEVIREELGRRLRAGAAAGELRDGVDPDTLLDVIAGTAIFAQSVRDVQDQDGLSAALVDIVLHGILPR